MQGLRLLIKRGRQVRSALQQTSTLTEIASAVCKRHPDRAVRRDITRGNAQVSCFQPRPHSRGHVGRMRDGLRLDQSKIILATGDVSGPAIVADSLGGETTEEPQFARSAWLGPRSGGEIYAEGLAFRSGRLDLQQSIARNPQTQHPHRVHRDLFDGIAEQHFVGHHWRALPSDHTTKKGDHPKAGGESDPVITGPGTRRGRLRIHLHDRTTEGRANKNHNIMRYLSCAPDNGSSRGWRNLLSGRVLHRVNHERVWLWCQRKATRASSCPSPSCSLSLMRAQ